MQNSIPSRLQLVEFIHPPITNLKQNYSVFAMFPYAQLEDSKLLCRTLEWCFNLLEARFLSALGVLWSSWTSLKTLELCNHAGKVAFGWLDILRFASNVA